MKKKLSHRDAQLPLKIFYLKDAPPKTKHEHQKPSLACISSILQDNRQKYQTPCESYIREPVKRQRIQSQIKPINHKNALFHIVGENWHESQRPQIGKLLFKKTKRKRYRESYHNNHILTEGFEQLIKNSESKNSEKIKNQLNEVIFNRWRTKEQKIQTEVSSSMKRMTMTSEKKRKGIVEISRRSFWQMQNFSWGKITNSTDYKLTKKEKRIDI